VVEYDDDDDYDGGGGDDDTIKSSQAISHVR
jgi:hypothetical protein